MSAIQQLITEHMDIWIAADTEKRSGRGRASGNAGSVYGVKKLRELILELAVRGKLVTQDANDEPASELLKRIQAEKAKLVAEGKIKKDKPLAPIGENEKPFELPQSWEWARLGFIGYTQTGATPSKSSEESFGSDVPFVKPGDIYPNYVEYNNEGLSLYGAKQSGRVAPSGSILMVCIGTIGKCNLIERDCSFNQQINSVTTYAFDSHYLLSVCRSIYFHTEAWSRSSSTTIAILNKGNWEDICIPIPPLTEQHRIVTKVDELMALCDQLEAQHSIAAEAHEKLVNHMLGTLTQSQSADDFSANWQRIAAHFDTLFTTEASIDGLKQTLLQLAVMGKLVPQDVNDEPASELLKCIQAEKAKLVAEGKIKKDKPLAAITDNEKPFELPLGWAWLKLGDLFSFEYGDNLPADKRSNTGEYPVYGSNGIVGTHNISFVESPCIVIGRKGSAGALNLCQTHGCCVTDVAYYCIPPNMIDIRFSYKLLHTLGLDELGKGIKPGLNRNEAYELIVAIPPQSEQERIVIRVDEIMALCDHLKTRITKINQIQQKLAYVMVEQAVAA